MFSQQSTSSGVIASVPSTGRQLSNSEECVYHYVLRRVCGAQAVETNEYGEVGECSKVCGKSDNEELEDFVQRWMESVNRGSLKILKVQAYDFFKQVELCVYREIEHQTKTTGQVNPDGIIQTAFANVEIQFLWCLLVLDLNEEENNVLFAAVTKLWVTIRGHSYAAALVEKYKWAVSAQTKK